MLKLDAFDPAHADLVSAWAKSPREVMNWCSGNVAPVPPAEIIAWSDDPDTTAYTLTEDGIVLGYGELWTDEEEAEIELARLIVDPSLRGRGYGRRLTTELTARALAHYPTVSLRVNPENDTARFCYESAGFRRVDPATERQWNSAQPTPYLWMLYPQ